MLIELARILSEHPIGIGVDLLFFDAEDQGDSSNDQTWALGSQHWSRNKKPIGYTAKYGILLDMVGAQDAAFGKEGISRRFAKDIQDKIWTLAGNMGYSDFFQDYNSAGINDDHLYVNRDAGIKMVDIIHQSLSDGASFGPYHHTHDDNIDIISRRTLKVVGRVVTAVLYNESNGTF
jgi:Predicted aminopeptidases